jgi:hypothetical protein
MSKRKPKAVTSTAAPAAPATAARPHAPRTGVIKGAGAGTATYADSATVGRYLTFLSALAAHQAEPGFPAFFAQQNFAAKMQAFIDDEQKLGSSKVAYKSGRGLAEAQVSQGSAELEQGEVALMAHYGPTSATLADFGMKPKSTRPRRRKAASPGANQGPQAPPGGNTAPGVSSASGSSVPPATGGTKAAPGPPSSGSTTGPAAPSPSPATPTG